MCSPLQSSLLILTIILWLDMWYHTYNTSNQNTLPAIYNLHNLWAWDSMQQWLPPNHIVSTAAILTKYRRRRWRLIADQTHPRTRGGPGHFVNFVNYFSRGKLKGDIVKVWKYTSEFVCAIWGYEVLDRNVMKGRILITFHHPQIFRPPGLHR